MDLRSKKVVVDTIKRLINERPVVVADYNRGLDNNSGVCRLTTADSNIASHKSRLSECS